MARSSSAILIGALLVISWLPTAAAEDPTTGECDGVAVPLQVQIGLVCALAGLGTNAACPPNSETPISAVCTSVVSWSWLAYSRVDLAGAVTVTIHRDVQTCVDLVDAPPLCTSHAETTTESCTWDVGGECRGEARFDASWGPVDLELGEQFRVLSHVDIVMDATSNAAGVPIGSVRYADASETGAAVDVLDNGR